MSIFSTLDANTRHREPDGLDILYVCVFVSILRVYVVICVYNTISYIIQKNILHTSIFSHNLLEDVFFSLCCTRKTRPHIFVDNIRVLQHIEVNNSSYIFQSTQNRQNNLLTQILKCRRREFIQHA